MRGGVRQDMVKVNKCQVFDLTSEQKRTEEREREIREDQRRNFWVWEGCFVPFMAEAGGVTEQCDDESVFTESGDGIA